MDFLVLKEVFQRLVSFLTPPHRPPRDTKVKPTSLRLQQQRHGPPVHHEEEERGAGVRPPPGDAGRQHVQQRQQSAVILADLRHVLRPAPVSPASVSPDHCRRGPDPGRRPAGSAPPVLASVSGFGGGSHGQQ